MTADNAADTATDSVKHRPHPDKRRIDPNDIIGQTFGKLTAIEYLDDPRYRGKTYRCQCACGKEHIVRRYNLLDGRVQSCGCLRHDPKPPGERTRYLTPEARRARELRDVPVSYKIITHR